MGVTKDRMPDEYEGLTEGQIADMEANRLAGVDDEGRDLEDEGLSIGNEDDLDDDEDDDAESGG